MKTVNLVTDLCQKIADNNSIIDVLPWEDINEMILSSLYVRKNIYPVEQYKLLEDTVSSFLVNARQAAEQKKFTEVLDYLNALIYLLEAMPDIDYIGPYIEAANFNKTYADHLRRKTVVFIGDSHVNFFSGNEELTYVPIGHDINVCPNVTGLRTTSLHLGACLAYTVNKVNSSTGFNRKLDYLINNFLLEGSTLIFTLGESDIRAHIYKQAQLQGCSPFEIIDNIMLEYSHMLLHCKGHGFNVCIWGPIASQPDSYPISVQFPRSGSELDRNEYAKYFTDKLRAFCAREKLTFISILDDMLTGSGLTKEEMLTADRVHLTQSVLPLAVKRIEEAGIKLH